MILIDGGTGILGRAIAGRLLDAQRPVRILTREASRAAGLAARAAPRSRSAISPTRLLSEGRAQVPHT